MKNFSINCLGKNRQPIGAQNIAFSYNETDNHIVNFKTKSGDTLMAIDAEEGELVLNNKTGIFNELSTDSPVAKIKVSNIKLDYNENLTFTVDGNKTTYRISGKTLEQKIGRNFENVISFDDILDVDLPSTLFSDIESGLVSADGLPFQMFDAFTEEDAQKLGITKYQSNSKLLNMLKVNNKLYVGRGHRLIEIDPQNLNFYASEKSCVLGITVGRSSGITGKQKSGIAFNLTPNELKDVAAFALGSVENVQYKTLEDLQNNDIDYSRVYRQSATSKTIAEEPEVQTSVVPAPQANPTTQSEIENENSVAPMQENTAENQTAPNTADEKSDDNGQPEAAPAAKQDEVNTQANLSEQPTKAQEKTSEKKDEKPKEDKKDEKKEDKSKEVPAKKHAIYFNAILTALSLIAFFMTAFPFFLIIGAACSGMEFGSIVWYTSEPSKIKVKTKKKEKDKQLKNEKSKENENTAENISENILNKDEEKQAEPQTRELSNANKLHDQATYSSIMGEENTAVVQADPTAVTNATENKCNELRNENIFKAKATRDKIAKLEEELNMTFNDDSLSPEELEKIAKEQKRLKQAWEQQKQTLMTTINNINNEQPKTPAESLQQQEKARDFLKETNKCLDELFKKISNLFNFSSKKNDKSNESDDSLDR